MGGAGTTCCCCCCCWFHISPEERDRCWGKEARLPTACLSALCPLILPPLPVTPGFLPRNSIPPLPLFPKVLSVTLAPGKTEGIKVDQVDYADLDAHDKLAWILFENVMVPQDRLVTWMGGPHGKQWGG